MGLSAGFNAPATDSTHAGQVLVAANVQKAAHSMTPTAVAHAPRHRACVAPILSQQRSTHRPGESAASAANANTCVMGKNEVELNIPKALNMGHQNEMGNSQSSSPPPQRIGQFKIKNITPGTNHPLGRVATESMMRPVRNAYDAKVAAPSRVAVY